MPRASGSGIKINFLAGYAVWKEESSNKDTHVAPKNSKATKLCFKVHEFCDRLELQINLPH